MNIKLFVTLFLISLASAGKKKKQKGTVNPPAQVPPSPQISPTSSQQRPIV